MKHLLFHIDYTTHNNDYPEVAFSVDGREVQYLAMHSDDNAHWQASIDLADEVKNIRYAYQIVTAQGSLVRIEQNS